MKLNVRRLFDESISSSFWKQLLWLCLILIVLFVLPSMVFVRLCEGLSWSDALEIYIDPGNFSSKVNQLVINDTLINTSRKPGSIYWFSLTIAMFGAVAFTGMLISMCGNFIQRRVDRFKKGYVKYKFENHHVILGYNDMIPTVVRQIVNDKTEKFRGRIVLMTSRDVEMVRELLFTNLDKAERKKIVIVHGSRLSEESLKNICVAKAKCIYIIGEDDDVDHDTLNINSLKIIAKQIPDKKKTPCVTYLRSRSTFTLFQTSDIMDEVKKKIDFLPFSFDEAWARKVFVSCDSKINNVTYKPLDRGGISKDSEKHVHLIVIGMTQMGVLLAMEAAHICHFPNFKTKGKKTKITFLDENADTMMKFVVSANQRFFDNCHHSYYDGVVKKDFKPMKDFLDVEFEFLKGITADEWVREYVERCASDDNEILTIASCMNDTSKNLAAALYLPDIVYDKGVPIPGKDGEKTDCDDVVVLARQNTSAELLKIIKEKKADYVKYKNVYPFGMLNDGYELDEALYQWAYVVNYLYDKLYDTGEIPMVYDDNKMDESWDEKSVTKKWSNIYQAMTIPTKLRSVGIDYKSYMLRDLTETEIELLAEVEQNRWNVEKLLMGFRPVTDEEANLIAEDIKNNNAAELKNRYKDNLRAHYDIRPYSDLKEDEPGKNVNRYAIGMTKGIIGIVKTVTLNMLKITAFQQKVYDATCLIPRGEVITYGELARRIGCKSAQAVGQALRRNPFAPEVPCHRVVADDGSLCGFAGHRDGELIAKKRKLLEEEGVTFDGDKVSADKINVRH